MTWIEEILESTKELESPKSFWYWSALAAISAVVKDNIWLDRGGVYNLYPNIYVMLYAGSALKKGPPAAMAKKLVRKVNNTRVISGRSSIQGILKELGTAYTIPGGKVVSKSTGFIVASEFTSSLVEDRAAMTILTDLYDRQWNEDEWRQLLKMDQFSLKDPTLTMLIATNEAHFKDFVGNKDLHGGFIGRMFVISERKVRQRNSLIRKIKNPIDYEKQAIYLKKIASLAGAFETLEDTDAGDYYDKWYNEFMEDFDNSGIDDKTGTIGRFGDSVLKVAMLLSLAREDKLVITLDTMEEAVNVCEPLIGNVRKTAMNTDEGKAKYAAQKSMILAELLERPDHRISRPMLSKKFWMHINADELDTIMRSFDEAGMVKIHNSGGVIIYEMPDSVALEIKKFLKEDK